MVIGSDQPREANIELDKNKPMTTLQTWFTTRLFGPHIARGLSGCTYPHPNF